MGGSGDGPGSVLARSWSVPVGPGRSWSLVLFGPGRSRSVLLHPYKPGGPDWSWFGLDPVLVRPRSVLTGPGPQSLRSFAVLGLFPPVGPFVKPAAGRHGTSLYLNNINHSDI